MTSRKERLTVTVDRTLLDAGNAAVASGRSDSLSAWVNRALADSVVRERRLAAMRDAVAHYEAEFGVISDVELAKQARTDRDNAIVIRRSAATRTVKPRTAASKARGA